MDFPTYFTTQSRTSGATRYYGKFVLVTLSNLINGIYLGMVLALLGLPPNLVYDLSHGGPDEVVQVLEIVLVGKQHAQLGEAVVDAPVVGR